jgi:hypothetical protein
LAESLAMQKVPVGDVGGARDDISLLLIALEGLLPGHVAREVALDAYKVLSV